MALQEREYGEKQTVIDDTIYFPNRLEYFAGIILQGLVAGRSEKELRKVVPRAIELANELEAALDSAEG